MRLIQLVAARCISRGSKQEPMTIPRKHDEGQILHPADILIFCDDSSRKPVEEGVNQIAIVTDDAQALFLERGTVRRLDLRMIPQLKNLNARRGVEPEQARKVADYFTRHANRPAHFEAGLKALLVHNLQPLLAGDLFPERPIYENEMEYEQAWQSFKSTLRPSDCIFTACLSSPLSRTIAWATGGSWSHVASYVGGGEIAESTTSGLRRTSLDVYRGQQYWVANYRHIGSIDRPRMEEQTKQDVEAIFKQAVQGYNYRKAFWYGVRAFLGDHSHALVPNSMIYQGLYSLIAHV